MFGAAAAARRDHQGADALAPGAAGATAAVQQGLGTVRQVEMHHQVEFRQVEAAGGDVGGDTHRRAAVAQGGERVGAVGLAQLTGEGDGGEAVAVEPGVECPHAVAGGAEDQGGAAVRGAQDVDQGAEILAGGGADGAVFDVFVRARAVDGVDAQGVGLEFTGERGDGVGDGGAEQQGAAAGGGGFEDEAEILGKAEVEHLVGFVEHGDLDGGQVELVALDVVLEPARGADDDVAAVLQFTGFGPCVHAADTGDDAGAGLGVEPFQLALDLHRQFAGGGDHQGQGGAGVPCPLGLAQQIGREGDAIGHRLARAGAGRDQQVAAVGLGRENGGLDLGRLDVATGLERAFERRVETGKQHGAGNPGMMPQARRQGEEAGRSLSGRCCTTAIGAGLGRAMGEEGCSFLKKKNQKTFIRLGSAFPAGKRMKVFLLLFLQKKKILAYSRVMNTEWRICPAMAWEMCPLPFVSSTNRISPAPISRTSPSLTVMRTPASRLMMYWRRGAGCQS